MSDPDHQYATKPALTVAERLTYSATKLTTFSSGQMLGSGTGFFMSFSVREDGRHVPVIVTNKHVLSGCDRVDAILHIENEGRPSGDVVHCVLAVDHEKLINHPDVSIDLCAVPIGLILRSAGEAGQSLFFSPLDMSLVPSEEDWEYFDAIEDITMVGCPNGIFDTVNNLPICRRGITATSIAKKYNGKNEFMVDLACFPGSSGSPIFIFDRNGYLDRRDNSYCMGVQRLKLVGVLYSGPILRNDGRVILATDPRVEVNTMMHLGNAIRSSELVGLEAEINRLLGQ